VEQGEVEVCQVEEEEQGFSSTDCLDERELKINYRMKPNEAEQRNTNHIKSLNTKYPP